MDYIFVPMNDSYAYEIAYGWNYDGVYSFYNMTSDEDDLREFIDPSNWEGRIFAVLDENKDLAGFFQFTFNGDAVEIGLGLKPELTGKGNGKDFVSTGIDYLQKSISYKAKQIVLNVACFNERAIRLYKSLGFRETNIYKVDTNGSVYDFLTMKKDY